MRRLLFIIPLAIAVTAMAGCSTNRVGDPFGRLPSVETENEILGQVVFMQNCQQCHPHGEGGLAPGMNQIPTPKFLIATQVRLGLGAMPAFSEDLISDDELDAVVDYVVALRQAAR